MYHQSYDNSFQNKTQCIQYKTNLAFTGAIRGASKESLYKELGLEFLLICRKYKFRKSFYFYNIALSKSPRYENWFFPSAVIEWNRLDPTVRKSVVSVVQKQEQSLNLYSTAPIIKMNTAFLSLIFLAQEAMFQTKNNLSLSKISLQK